jgi:hypothetical protein
LSTDSAHESLEQALADPALQELVCDSLLREMLLYSVLRALVPFVPLPFVEGVAADRLGRRLFEGVAEAHGRVFLKAELDDLISDDDSWRTGCRGCLVETLLFPYHSVRMLKRLLFTPLEIKRVVDSTSRFFIEAFLVHQILQARRWPEGGSAVVRQVMTRVCRQVGTGPIELLLSQALRSTGHKLQELFELLLQRLRQVMRRDRKNKQAVVARALEELEVEHRSQVEVLLEAWMVWLRQLPVEYRNQLTRATLEGLEAG